MRAEDYTAKLQAERDAARRAEERRRPEQEARERAAIAERERVAAEEARRNAARPKLVADALLAQDAPGGRLYKAVGEPPPHSRPGFSLFRKRAAPHARGNTEEVAGWELARRTHTSRGGVRQNEGKTEQIVMVLVLLADGRLVGGEANGLTTEVAPDITYWRMDVQKCLREFAVQRGLEVEGD